VYGLGVVVLLLVGMLVVLVGMSSVVVFSSSSMMVEAVVVGRGSISRGLASLSAGVCSFEEPSASEKISSVTSRLMARLIELNLLMICWFCLEPKDGVTRTERRTRRLVSTILVPPILMPVLFSSSLHKLPRNSPLL